MEREDVRFSDGYGKEMKFVNAVFLGRLLRYSLLACLGAQFGDRAADVVKEHFPVFMLTLAAGLILFLVVRYFRSQAKVAPGK